MILLPHGREKKEEKLGKKKVCSHLGFKACY